MTAASIDVDIKHFHATHLAEAQGFVVGVDPASADGDQHAEVYGHYEDGRLIVDHIDILTESPPCAGFSRPVMKDITSIATVIRK